MPFDVMPQGNPWGAWDDVCQGCKGLIAPGQAIEHVQFDPDPANKLEEMNGAYHAECARPILSMKRALDALGRALF